MKYNGVIQRKFALLDDHVQELTRYLSTMDYREFEEIDPRLLFDLATTRLTDLLAFRDEIDRAG